MAGAGPDTPGPRLGRALAGLGLGLWLGGGLVALVQHGPWATGRVRLAPGAGASVAEAWGGGGLGAQLDQLEALLDRARAAGDLPEVVILQRREGVNPLIGLATQRLFPTLVVPAWPKQVADLAAETGAGAVLRFEPGSGWTLAELAP
jgi:hypothetical protein